MTEIKSNLKVQGQLVLHNYTDGSLNNLTDIDTGTIAMNNGSLVKYDGTGWSQVDKPSGTTLVYLNGTAYTLPNTSVLLSVSSATTVTASDNYKFANYSYLTYTHTSTNSNTRSFSPGLYEINIDKNNSLVKVNRRPDPKDVLEVIANGSGTTLTSNYNTTETAGIDFDFDVVRLSSNYGYFTPNLTSNQITINKTGRYRIFYNLGHTSTGQRASLEAFITVNGTDLGHVRSRSYVRNNSGHTTDNIVDEETLSLNKDDVIQLRVRRAQGSTIEQAINVIKGSHLSIEWVSSNGV